MTLKYLANNSTNDETPYYSVLSFLIKHVSTDFYFPTRFRNTEAYVQLRQIK